MLKRILLLSCFLTIGLTLYMSALSKATPELLAHWTFDQIENNMIKDIAGNSDGTVIGNWTESNHRPGLYGKALYFGDLVSVSQIRLESSAAISLTDNFMLECIIKPKSVDGFRTIIWKGNRNVTPEAINYAFDIRDGKPEIKFKDAEGKWSVYSTPKAVLEAGNWYQLIFTKKAGDINIYVNGEKQLVRKSENSKGINLIPNEYNAYIGAGNTHAGTEVFLFEGLIDDIKIYSGTEVNIPEDFQSKWQQLISKNTLETTHFDKVQAQYKMERQEKLQQEYSAFFKQQALKSNASFALSVLPTTKRLVKSPDFFKELDPSRNTVHISAARNEYESFNVVVLGNPVNDTQISDVHITDLVNIDGSSSISATDIAVGYIKDVITSNSNIPVDFIGGIPDVVMKGVTNFKVHKGSFTPILVKVYTGNAAPGTYKGTVELKGNGHNEKVDVYLQVYDFALPKKGSLRTAFSFFNSFYKQWYGIDEISDKQEEDINEFLLEYRLSPNNIYSNEPIHPDVKKLEKMKERTNFFTINGYGNPKKVSDETLKKQVDSVGANIEKIQQIGLQDDMYYYSYDEISGHGRHINSEKLAAAKQINLALLKNHPNLRLMQTSPPEKDIEDLFNVWVPLFNYFDSKENLETIARLKKRGDEIWWYATQYPTKPYPNYFLDYPVFDSRIVPTLSYMYDIDGLLYWCINREWLTNLDIRQDWPDAKWKPYTYHIHNGTRIDRHGMGNFIYPGPSGKLLPSLRLENLRDGLEDYEYLKELERSVKKLEKADIKGNDVLLKEAKELLKVPASVAVAVNEWSSNPAHLLEYRNRIGEVITKIHARLKSNA